MAASVKNRCEYDKIDNLQIIQISHKWSTNKKWRYHHPIRRDTNISIAYICLQNENCVSRITLTAKSPNKLVSLLLRSQLRIYIVKEKYLSTFTLSTIMIYSIFRSFREVFSSIMDHSCCMLSDLHLVRSLWNYAVRDIVWSHFSIRHWIERAYLIFYRAQCNVGGEPSTFVVWSLFLTETRFYTNKRNIRKW